MRAATERFLVRLDQGLLTQHAFLAVRHMGEGLVEAARTGNISYAQAFARRILLHVRDEHAHVGSADKIQWQLFARWTEELIESTEQVVEANLEAGMDAPSSFHHWLHEDNRADEWVSHEKMRRQ